MDYYDDPPAPQEPPQIHTPLPPPRPRLTPHTDSHPQTSQTRTIEAIPATCTTCTTSSKNKSRTRISSSALLNGATAHLSPPTTMLSPLALTRRGTMSVAPQSERHNSADMDSRSMISSLLDAYCRSDDTWDDDASEIYSDETASLDYLASPSSVSSVCTFHRRHGSNSTIVASELAPRRSKSTTLLIEAPPQWDSLASTSSAPRTAPVNKNMRPLPPLPPSQRSNINTYLQHLQYLPHTQHLLLHPAILHHKPIISKHHLLPPLLTISASPSTSQQQQPSPLDIPIPPSPMTARRHQATKLTKILGEQISPELLGPNGAIRRVQRLPTPPPVSTTAAQTAKNQVTLPPTRRIQSRAVRPHAIYAFDDTTSEESDNDHVSLFDFTEIKVEFLNETEESDDTGSSSDPSEILSPSDSILELEMEELEEARIGRALQNVIRYQKADRVKRTSRMWVLEKNGQRWEEEDQLNIRRALRQL
ncbi:hypothetical protein Agabi119p4_8776 [Agaricus bisporus var. burnettii]|uniref:Uncharacterized protein n=1 Tax=Agaricus bisporus var. burnettii TaxID=192524 RepID=A0A8H7C520_AGABI|nr:hypothetical protein Agabi119p4_8776 [Agaricus bisporus var. burnettii]